MKIAGIDLGTTFSAIALLDDIGNPEILPSLENERVTPSVVFFGDNKKIEVGATAINSGKLSPSKEVREVKKKMESKDSTFDINTGDWVESVSDGETKFTPAQISSFILSKLKSYTSDVKDVVVTIPANYGERARKATVEACELAGLNSLTLINEPTAAILHYAHLPNVTLSGRVLVFDLGGGTFDVSMAEVEGRDIKIITSRGDTKLGGTNFDREISKILVSKYESEKNATLEIDNQLMSKAERIKKILSTKESASDIVEGEAGPLKIEITREEFLQSISLYLEKIKMLLEECLESSKTKKDAISEILLVGGSTRIPGIVDLISSKLGKSPKRGVNVDEAVACGAVIKAGMLSVERLNEVQKKAMGKVSLKDVLNYYFGTIAQSVDKNTNEYVMRNTIILSRDAEIPVTNTESYFTVNDNQTGVDLTITRAQNLEVDPEFVDILYETSLELPPNRPAGQEILVTYSYDGVTLNATFKDTASGKEQKIDLELTGLSSNQNKPSDDDPFLDFKIED